MDWLKQIDPNIIAPFVVTVLTTLGGWLWAKVRNEKHESFTDTIEGMFRSFVSELFAKYESGDVAAYVQTSRAWMERKSWEVLTKRGVPKNDLLAALVHAAIEHATADLTEKLNQWLVDRAKIESGLREMSERLDATSRTMATAKPVEPP